MAPEKSHRQRRLASTFRPALWPVVSSREPAAERSNLSRTPPSRCPILARGLRNEALGAAAWALSLELEGKSQIDRRPNRRPPWRSQRSSVGHVLRPETWNCPPRREPLR